MEITGPVLGISGASLLWGVLENGEVEGARLYAMMKKLINVLLVVWEPLQVLVRGAMGSELVQPGRESSLWVILMFEKEWQKPKLELCWWVAVEGQANLETKTNG